MIDGIYFGEGDKFVSEVKNKNTISIIYYPEINSYMGRETIQVVVKSYQ